MSSSITLELLPARHGDCLLLTYPVHGRRARMLVDAGPKEAWAQIEPRLRASLGKVRHVDLLVVTHVDTDHIEGALLVTRSAELGLSFEDVWFNGLAHLEADRAGTDRGGVQGEFLAAVLAEGHWNEAFGRESVRVDDDGEPTMLDGGDAQETITIVSPDRTQCRRMAATWTSTCAAKGIPTGDTEQVLALLADDARYDVRGTASDRPRSLGGDSSEANGSSIALLFELGGKRLLLSGDAYADVMAESIRRLLAGGKEARLHLDAFKLSHHGSRNNITAALLDLIDCDVFLVSTNGDKFRHPDPETIELIASRAAAAGRRPTVWFNYRSETTERFAKDPRIVACYGTDGYAKVPI